MKKSLGRLLEWSIIILNYGDLSSLAGLMKSRSANKPQGEGPGQAAAGTESGRRLS